jgi:hypothetical protein
MQNWWATVDWLRDKINAPRLTLRLIGAEAHFHPTRGFDPARPKRYLRITPTEGDKIMQSYIDIVRPLRTLAGGASGLARVHVDFGYP